MCKYVIFYCPLYHTSEHLSVREMRLEHAYNQEDLSRLEGIFLAFSALVAAANTRSLLTYTGVANLTGLPNAGAVMAAAVGRPLGVFLQCLP